MSFKHKLEIDDALDTYPVHGVGTWIILKIIDATVGLRVKEEAEYQGLDINEHGEEGYNSEFGDRPT